MFCMTFSIVHFPSVVSLVCIGSLIQLSITTCTECFNIDILLYKKSVPVVLTANL